MRYKVGLRTYGYFCLGINFKRTGRNAYCPFRFDRKDNFRVYIDGEEEVKVHCFGECKMNWDIYDVILLRSKCSSPASNINVVKVCLVRLRK